MLTILMAVSALYQFELPSSISWLMPWGVFAVVAAMLLLANTICKKKA
ncbi:MAG: hypothetical protein GX096_05750 [Clostridiales bacterium]|nr:hypothetical protein [Clostridiales bacterium]